MNAALLRVVVYSLLTLVTHLQSSHSGTKRCTALAHLSWMEPRSLMRRCICDKILIPFNTRHTGQRQTSNCECERRHKSNPTPRPASWRHHWRIALRTHPKIPQGGCLADLVSSPQWLWVERQRYLPSQRNPPVPNH
ncbi:hypothetical protein JAAARDRAFT_297651 [Jaapia argillacea MUCL 33604]|uniref:Secreted protein n=1 Tax=Jaapia argillacea MUCL 33604 TaxID=933084 RepID=A0A067PPF6_9AGAM|nr:hypothetical protein JAAARDRAFT_297651 [Jaapia argillacea MUCL 33604]